VTGGAGHIGRAICESLLAEGAEVIAVGRREPADPIASQGREATFYSADIRDPAASQALIDFLSDRFGRLDILVNNAGGGPPVAAADASAELTQKIISLNLLAPLVLSQQAHPLLAQAPAGGSIVNIASVSGARPQIRVNALIVGLVHNEAGVEHYGGEEGFKRVADMLPLKRMASPQDVANAVMLMCSDRASYISGANLEVDGGGEVPVFLHLASESSKAK